MEKSMPGRFLTKITPLQNDGSDEEQGERVKQLQSKLRRSNCGKALNSPQKMNNFANAKKSSAEKPPITTKTNGRSVGLQKPATNKRGSRVNSIPSASSASLYDLYLGTSKSSMQVPQERKEDGYLEIEGKKP
jgi:hypothetical protein